MLKRINIGIMGVALIVTSNYKAFLDLRNELIKTGKINPVINNFNIVDNNVTALNVPWIKTDSFTVSPLTSTNKREDLVFTRKNGLQPHYIYGQITPKPGSPLPPAGYTSYHELEIHLNQAGDTVEYISDHRSNEISVWIALWDNNVWKSVPTPYFDYVNGPIEYYFNYNAGGHYYDMYLYNPATGQARENTYTDSDTSTFIDSLDADVELTYTTLQSWYDESTIEQWVAQVGSTFYNPTDVFNMGSVQNPAQYVSVSGIPSSGHFITTHKDGLNVP
jgi:hypothetical protein